jgi:hypothetical protein
VSARLTVAENALPGLIGLPEIAVNAPEPTENALIVESEFTEYT